MGVAGRTAPGSGMEHTVSHLLEMAEPASDRCTARRSASLSVLAALLWARVREAAPGRRATRAALPRAPREMEPRVRAAFAELDPCGARRRASAGATTRASSSAGTARAATELRQRWAAFDAELDGLLASPERLAAALAAAGAPLRLTELGIDAGTARWALANCHLMRDRFTVADLAFFMGIWDADDVDALLDDAARLGVGL